MDVDGGVEFGTSLVQVDDGLYGQRPRALCSVEGEVPPLAAGVLTFEPEGAAEEHPEGAVRAQLGERAVLQHSAHTLRSLQAWATLEVSEKMRFWAFERY